MKAKVIRKEHIVVKYFVNGKVRYIVERTAEHPKWTAYIAD